MGLFFNDDEDEEKRAEEERRKADEERRAEAEKRREEAAAARAAADEKARREREEEQRRAEQERQDRMEMRGEETTSGETGALGQVTGEPSPPPPPPDEEPPRTFSMMVGEPTVEVPEGEIEVTPFAAPEPEPAPPPRPSPMDRVADIAIAQGSQQSMADQGYGEPPPPSDQRAVLRDMAQDRAASSETGGALSAPTPPPAAAAKPGEQLAPTAAPQAQRPMAPMAPPQAARQPDPGLLDLQRAADESAGRGDTQAAELAKAQRRDRILKAISGLVKAAAGIGGGVAAIRGNPIGRLAAAGVSGLGGVVGSLDGYGDDTVIRQRGQRQDEQLASRERHAVQSARQYDRQLGQTDEAQRQRMALAQANRADARADAAREAARTDELAPIERAMMDARLRGQQTRTEAQRQEMELARARSERADQLAQAQVAQMERRRRGGSRQSTSSANIPVTDTVRRRVAEEYPDATPAQRQQIEQRVMEKEGADVILSTDARQASRERSDERSRATLPGFQLKEGERPPDDVSWRGLREGLTAYRDARRQLTQMTDSLGRSGVLDVARSAVTRTDDSAQYDINRNSVMSALQKMSGGGVLTDGDVARLSALVPSYADGSIRNGEASLRAMLNDMTATVRNRMDVYGYTVGDGNAAAAPGGGRRSYRIQATDGETTAEMTREEAAQKRAAGFRVTVIP